MPRRPAPRAELVSLLRAAKQSPEEDAPRLVLADWLEEHGGPADKGVAELIRLQVLLARRGGDGAEQRALQKREREAWKACSKAWLAGLRKCFPEQWTVERGLVGVGTTAAALLSRTTKALD